MKRKDDDHVALWSERGTTYVKLPIVALVAMLFLIAALTLLLWSAKRRRDVRLQVQTPAAMQELMPSIVGITQSSLDGGNRIELLQNGDEFFPRLLADINAARQSVHVESYIWWEGAICNQLAEALAAKARQGVKVRLLVDASGGHKMDKKLAKLMESAGVRLARFHPFRFSNLGRINNRDHRKVMIIDGRIGYAGGYGISDEWTGNAQDRDHWRDTGVRVEGPLVNRLQGAFCENWIEETGEIPAGPEYFPRLPPAGNIAAHVAYTSPTGTISSVHALHYLAIRAARREIIIQNPYLLPDTDAIKALVDAARRGVQVRIMVPSTTTTDSPVVQHASHHRFGNLLKHGIRIWEYERTLLHQKVMVVDGEWSLVGSTNFDARSFEVNDELSIGILDRAIAERLRAAFADDMKYAKERRIDTWRDRPLWDKLLDGLAYLAHEQL